MVHQFRGGGGGGGGGDPEFFEKHVFEIADGQQTRTRDQNFERVPDPNLLPVPTVQQRPYLITFCPNYAKSPQHVQISGALLVASVPLNS